MSTSPPVPAGSSPSDAARVRHGAAGVVAQYIQDLAHAQATA